MLKYVILDKNVKNQFYLGRCLLLYVMILIINLIKV